MDRIQTAQRMMGTVIAVLLVLLAAAPFARAISEPEKNFLLLYFTEAELQVVSATRSLQSISRIAENISIVTAADIELLNAHSLADVLDTVAGVQSSSKGLFGAKASASIQGAGGARTTVLMNGVPLAFVSVGIAEIGFCPVQDIEKIEIVKGPASSAWGSALGGVVNVITKRPADKPFQGTAVLGYGTKNSADYRAVLSGRLGGLGYYLSGTGLRSDGLIEGYDQDAGHLGARLEYAFTRSTTAAVNLFYGDASRGDGIMAPYDLVFDVRSKRLVSDLALASAIGEEGRLDLSAWTTSIDESLRVGKLSDGTEIAMNYADNSHSGTGLRYTWTHGAQSLVVGADYSAGSFTNSELPGQKPSLTQGGLYLNDTINLGPLTFAPGIRYDDASNTDAFWSPSLGAVYSFSKDVLARATVARGFSSPSLESLSATSEYAMYQANPDLAAEKVWSYQLGLEANVAGLFRLKVSGFRHDVEDALEMTWLSEDWWTFVNTGRERRQGLEAEVETRPFHQVSLAGDAFFMDTENLETHEDVEDMPTRIVDLGLKYDDERSFRALFRGRYWHADEPVDYNADLDGFIFDLTLIKKFAGGAGVSPEAFLAVHNIFGGAQYRSEELKNPGRWVEGGVRVSF